MLIAFQELLGGFEKRASQVRKLLQSSDCRFLVVCTSQENSVAETIDFHARLKSYDYRLGGIVVNRVYAGTAFSTERVEADRNALEESIGRQVAELLVANYRNHVPLMKRDKKSLERLASAIGAKEVTTVPLFYSDVHDLKGLSRIAVLL
jgi:anion-transporting  ArsA/GET3 family ATPase